MRKKQSKDLTSNGNYAILHLACGRGGTGRRVRLRGVWETVWVQVPSTAPTEKTIILSSFFSFSAKMMRRCRSVGAHVRCARATQMQALDCPSLAVDRTKKMTCTFIVQVFFLQGSKGLERDVKKTARCAVFSPRRDSNRISGAKKGVQNACARRVAEQVPSTAPTKKTIVLSSFFHFLSKMMRRCRLFQKTHFKATRTRTDTDYHVLIIVFL